MQSDLAHIISRCFVNIPFTEFDKYKKLVHRHRINPEIGLAGDALYIYSERDFTDLAEFLSGEGLSCTLHAPFSDLMPGSSDKYILKATRDKLRRCFDLIEVFQPDSVVCHLGYLDWVHSYHLQQWLDISLETWRILLEVAKSLDTPVMFENTYESTPRIHKLLLESLASPSARFCLDVGHLLAFSRTPWPKWLAVLEPWLGQLHLHDNKGLRDDHLPIGRGYFDFTSLFSYLQTKNIRPILTLEPRSKSDLWESLNALDRLGIFDHKKEVP
jgi:sugar phosphate isomerase/epimerase